MTSNLKVICIKFWIS